MDASAVLCLLFVILLGASTEALNYGRNLPKTLFVIGDSDADTGNIMKPLASSWVYPAGITFPGKPSGRFSDGRVLTDFIAEYLGIPSPVNYEERQFAGDKKRYGMNFAYGGTGLFNTQLGTPNFTVQISNLEQLVRDGTYSRQQLRSSVVFFCANGGDYGEFLLNHLGTPEAMKGYTKTVISQTVVDLRRLVSIGVRRIALTALLPTGCLPLAASVLSSTACLEVANEQANYHNMLLHEAVGAINDAYPGRSTRIGILPMYDALTSLLKDDRMLAAKFDSTLKQCCLGVNGGDCGSIDGHGKPLYQLCANPGRALFWDRVHPTQAGWSAIVQHLYPTMDQLFS